jgi:hypothetical protein
MPLALLPVFRRNLLYAICGGLVFAGLFYLLLSRSTGQLITNYVDADYESSGAVRVAMNLVPAILALTLRQRCLSIKDGIYLVSTTARMPCRKPLYSR